MFKSVPEALTNIGPSFQFEPFAPLIQPIIQESLSEHGKDKFRKGTILTPCLVVWVVLTLTLRRDINYPKALSWLVSRFRWLCLDLPAKLVKDGAVSHARVRLGVGVIRDIFYRLVRSAPAANPDFHQWTTVMFDGAAMTMPDTSSNRERFGKPKSGRGCGAFPQLRAVALLVLSARLVFDVAYAPFRGKKTGERTLMFEILERVKRKDFLFVFDAGFYSFFLTQYMAKNELHFIMKVSNSLNLPALHGSFLPDGSYFSVIKGKIPGSQETVEINVRVIAFQIPGFRPVRLITTIVDEDITAREIIIHYHKRWDIEIAYDEIKTHQCATLRGQMPTVIRSKRADLVEQELWAIMTTYNLIRSLIHEAARKHNKDACLISFLDSMQLIIEAAPLMSTSPRARRKQFDYLLDLIGDSEIDRPRRPRVAPRVVKVKMSKFKRKRAADSSKYRDFEKNLQIITQEAA